MRIDSESILNPIILGIDSALLGTRRFRFLARCLRNDGISLAASVVSIPDIQEGKILDAEKGGGFGRLQPIWIRLLFLLLPRVPLFFFTAIIWSPIQKENFCFESWLVKSFVFWLEIVNTNKKKFSTGTHETE